MRHRNQANGVRRVSSEIWLVAGEIMLVEVALLGVNFAKS